MIRTIWKVGTRQALNIITNNLRTIADELGCGWPKIGCIGTPFQFLLQTFLDRRRNLHILLVDGGNGRIQVRKRCLEV